MEKVKKTIEKLSVSSAFIILLLYVGFVSVGYQIFAKNVVYDVMGYDKEWFINTIKTSDNLFGPVRKKIEWKKSYPFPKTGAYSQVSIDNAQLSDVGRQNSDKNVSSKISWIYDMFEKYTKEYFSFYHICEGVSKQLDICLGNRLSFKDCDDLQLFLKDGRMTYERPYRPVDKQIGNIVNFEKWLDSKNITYFNVIIPAPVCSEEEKEVQARGYRCYSNKMADELARGLRSKSIKCIDIREYMKVYERSYTDDFFRYEHHMVPRAGLWVSEIVATQIKQTLGVEYDKSIFDIKQYKISSVEKKSELLNDRHWVYSGTEPLDMFYPKFDTDITKQVVELDLSITGDFEQTMYAMWNLPSYNVWNHGLRAIKTYRNNLINVRQPKILLLTDSYSDVITPFLALSYANIDEIDLRCFTGSLQTYIEETQPDLVISMYSAYVLNVEGDNELFEFQ